MAKIHQLLSKYFLYFIRYYLDFTLFVYCFFIIKTSMKSGLQAGPLKITLNCPSCIHSFCPNSSFTDDSKEFTYNVHTGAIHSTKIPTGPTEKSGPSQKVDQFFRNFSGRNGTDPLSFGPKFPVILVEWIAP